MLAVSDLGKESNSPAFVSVAAGRDHSLAVAVNGDVYAAGSNTHGQLGLAGFETCDMFSKVHSCENVKVAEVFAGGNHSFILLNDYLKKGAPKADPDYNIPDIDDGLIAFKEDQDDLLGSFTPDEQIQLSPGNIDQSPLNV